MAENLLAHLRQRIQLEGPLPVSEYMAECLLHPRFGYYSTRESIGAAGDFTTAPEISQMFGELLGLWAADTWQALGAPPHFYLVEAGPGRGTLMRDALRAAGMLPKIRAAIRPVLIEMSERLRGLQRSALAGTGAVWVNDIDAVPRDAPVILLANEFLDALPVRQYVSGENGWHERCVDLTPDSTGLRFVLSDTALPLVARLPEGEVRPGLVLEACPQGHAFVAQVADRLAGLGGAALLIDYGPGKRGFGDSLQALQGKAFADPLASPGEADLTAHVDFAGLAETARQAGAAVHGPVSQGQFLRSLGIEARAARLRQSATPDQAREIDLALHRLTAPDAMGNLFKVLCLTRQHAPTPAGFP